MGDWCTPSLNFASRLVLVKHTLSSIPVYLFSVFRAPSYFVSKVRSLMVQFLWGKGDRGGVCWRRWSELCKPMHKDGLGLRDLGCFNQVLLAKMAWRLIRDPDSLVAKVLLGKYSWGKSLWDCHPKPGCSWGWRSIMWGLDLLRKGLCWRVGDGEDVTVFGHQWIAQDCNPYLVRGKPSGICNFKVKDLFDGSTGEWWRSLVNQLFPLRFG